CNPLPLSKGMIRWFTRDVTQCTTLVKQTLARGHILHSDFACLGRTAHQTHCLNIDLGSYCIALEDLWWLISTVGTFGISAFTHPCQTSISTIRLTQVATGNSGSPGTMGEA